MWVSKPKNWRFITVESKTNIVAWIGAIGFPGYYVIWTEIYPQQYENIYLRAIGCMLSCLFFFEDRLMPDNQRFWHAYRIFYCTLVIPVFFTFMNLMNDASPIWQMSYIASILYLALLTNAREFIGIALGGTAVGIAAFAVLNSWEQVPVAFFEAWPIHLFILIGGFFFNYSDALAQSDRQIKAAAAIGASVAHELRTPLLALRLDLDSLKRDLARVPTDPEGSGPRDGAEGAALDALIQRIERQVNMTSLSLDILLANTLSKTLPKDVQIVPSVRAFIDEVVRDMPIPPDDLGRITLEGREDFAIRASPVILRHVLHNLLKNSLRAIKEKGCGSIAFELEVGRSYNLLSVRDSGVGIADRHVNLVFEPFFSRTSSRTGIGLGLTFCKAAMEQLGGEILLQSKQGEYTRIQLLFPTIQS